MIILWLATYLLVIGAVGFALTAAILGSTRRRMIELFALPGSVDIMISLEFSVQG